MADNKIRKYINKIIKEELSENYPTPPAPKIKKGAKSTVVHFNKGTSNEFKAVFSERGFSINETRMSFETIENALSKGFIITLANGQGPVLDAVTMQKIMKYEGLY